MNEERLYRIHRWNGARPELDGRVFAPENEAFCRTIAPAEVNCYAWDANGYRPEARAYVARTADGLLVLMCAKEARIAAAETRIGGDVYKDSCLEFFLNAKPSKGEKYVNVEVNCAGIAHIGFGEGRPNRRVLRALPKNMRISHSTHAGEWWAVCYNLPQSMLDAEFGGMENEMKGNFFKCDESIHPHFGSWNPISAPQPDFHRPECFGRILLSDD